MKKILFVSCAGLAFISAFALSQSLIPPVGSAVKSVFQHAVPFKSKMPTPSEPTVASSFGHGGMHRVAPIAPSTTYADSLILYGTFRKDNDASGSAFKKSTVLSFHAAPQILLRGEFPTDKEIPDAITSFYAKGKYYFVRNEVIDNVTYGRMDIYDAETWKPVQENIDLGVFNSMYASTYDPLTGKAYLMSWGENYKKDFSSIDLETFEVKKLSTMSLYITALAAHPDGNIYAVCANDWNLYKASKEDGTFTKIGKITSNAQNAVQSAVTDWATGRIYWMGVTRDFKSHLYTIDEKTGTATMMADMPNYEKIVGLYIPHTEAKAPAASTGIKFEYDGIFSLSGKLSFKVPTRTYDGTEALTGDLTVYVTIDGETEEFPVNAGQEVSLNRTLTNGVHTIGLQISNKAGKSPLRRFDTFAGTDLPSAVTDLAFTLDANRKATVTWKAPTISQNGGAVDDESIRYKVIREPNSVVVSESQAETTFVETLTEARANYYYRIIPMVNGAEGDEAVSNRIASGNKYVPPFVETFEAKEDFDLYTVIDADDDSFTWIYGSYAKDVSLLNHIGSDDYLITPPVQLGQTHAYKLSVSLAGGQANRPTTLKFLLMKSETLTGEETEVGSVIVDGETGHYSTVFAVPEAGTYRLALHAFGNYTVSIHLDDLAMAVDAAMTAPNGVTDLKATAGAQGALSNTLTFRAPTTTYEGNALNKINRIEIFRNDKQDAPVHTIENPTAGATLTWTDTEIGQGMVTYAIRAYNESGMGKEVTVSNYVGIDTPCDVANFKAAMPEYGKALLKWEAPQSAGGHGGYVDLSQIYYQIYRYDATLGWTMIADQVREQSYTDASFKIPEGQQQDYAQYGIYACNATGRSYGASLGIKLGTPYNMPYRESFPEAMLNTVPWNLHLVSGKSGWNVTTGQSVSVKPNDGDLGMLYFSNTDEDSNPCAEIIDGPRISMKGSSNPMLAFYMYHGFEAEPEDLHLAVLVSADDADTVRVASLPYNNGKQGWERHVIELDKFAKADNLILSFYAYALDGSASIYVDNIVVDEYAAKDLSLLGYGIPKRLTAGETGQATATVLNAGSKQVNDWKISLYRDDVEVATTDGGTLDANATKDFSFNIPAVLAEAGQTYSYTIKVEMDGDEKAADNVSEAVSLYINGPKYPKVTDLSGKETEGTVALSWTKPSPEMTDPLTETFDTYQPYLIDGIGDWTVYDGDKASTCYFSSNVTIPNQYQPQAWQVWNRDLAGFEKFDVLKPHSGDQFLIAWSAADPTAFKMLPNDNWLISAEISGGSDVSFFAKEAVATSGPELFEVMYSTTDTKPESFKAIGNETISDTEWREYAYTLPDDAKYFAIHHYTQKNGQTMILDDITYTPLYGTTTELTFEGFNVYRDGQRIASGVKEAAYADAGAEIGEHVYRVSVQWNTGESMLSAPCTVNVRTSILTETAAIAAEAIGGEGKIIIRNADGLMGSIYSVDGRKMYMGTMEAYTEIPVGKGAYVVRIASETYKVIVK